MDDQAILQYAAAHWREMRVVGRGTHTSGILETELAYGANRIKDALSWYQITNPV